MTYRALEQESRQLGCVLRMIPGELQPRFVPTAISPRRVEWTTQADGGTIANLFEQVPRRGIRARQLWGAVQ